MKGATTGPVRPFAVSTKYHPDEATIVHARSAGAAKYAHWLSIADCYPDSTIAIMRAVVVRGPVAEPERFRRCVERRGIAGARIGMKVRTRGGVEGVIVGSNDSANLDVLLDGWSGPANCHPGDLTFLGDDGRTVDVRPVPAAATAEVR